VCLRETVDEEGMGLEGRWWVALAWMDFTVEEEMGNVVGMEGVGSVVMLLWSG